MQKGIQSPVRVVVGRIVEIDVLRGIAIILMITGHSFIIHPINILDVPWCSSVSHWIYTFHMELFFLLSGCVYHCTNYKSYIVKKIDRIMIPYLFFGLITLLLHSAGLGVVNKQTPFLEGVVKFLFKGGNYWFLYTLFVLYLIYPFVDKMLRKPWMEIGLGALLIFIQEFAEIPNLFTVNRVIYYMPYFILGRYLVTFLKSDKADSLYVNVVVFMISLSIFVILDRMYGVTTNIVTIKYIRAMMMIIVVYVLVRYFVKYSPLNIISKRLVQLLNNCSQYSLQIYLFNGFLLVGIRVIVVSILHIYNPIIIVSSLVLGNIFITLFVCKYLLPHTKWLGWLCGTGKRPFGKS